VSSTLVPESVCPGKEVRRGSQGNIRPRLARRRPARLPYPPGLLPFPCPKASLGSRPEASRRPAAPGSAGNASPLPFALLPAPPASTLDHFTTFLMGT
jgi:hypothetical protein